MDFEKGRSDGGVADFGDDSDEEAKDERVQLVEPIPVIDSYRPTSNPALNETEKFQSDMARLPDAMTEDQLTNVDTENVAMMLMRGMKRRDGTAWKPGESLHEGGMLEAQVAVPKQRGAGLGSDSANVYDQRPGQSNRATLVAAGDKPRNYVGVSEKLVKRKVVEPGALVVITAGSHEGETAYVRSMPPSDGVPRKEDKITLELECSGAAVTAPYGLVRLYSHADEERKRYEHKKRESDRDEGREAKRAKKRAAVPLTWVIRRDMLVRFVDRSYAGGKHYNEKLRVFDITSKTDFSLQTNEGAIIDGVVESQVETVIPREPNAKLVILKGTKKGTVARLAEKDKKREEVVVLFEGSLAKTSRYSYYDVCAV